MATLTRFRSSERDSQTDSARVEAVERALRDVLVSIEREQHGLSRRLEETSARVAGLMGTEDGIYYEREAADEQMLVEAEAQMMQAYRRLDALKAQHASFARLLDRVRVDGGGGPREPDDAAHNRGDQRPDVPSFDDERRSERTAAPEWWRRLSAAGGWLIVAVIVYATLSSVEQRPRVVSIPPDVERFFSYLAGALALGIGYPGHRRLLLAAGTAFVLVLELGQAWTVSRHGTWGDALAKTAGLACAYPIVVMFEAAVRRGDPAGPFEAGAGQRRGGIG